MEIDILNWIQENMRGEVLDFIMPKISFLGNAGMIWIILAAFFLLWKKHRTCGIRLSAGLVSSLVVGNILLKNLIKRPRPCWIVDVRDMLIEIPSDYSFPSGHTLASFIGATIIFKYNKTWGIFAYVLASLIAFSRMYLYVHYPTDIAGGIVLGIVIGLLVSKFVIPDSKCTKENNCDIM